jgi:hypothetical protein
MLGRILLFGFVLFSFFRAEAYEMGTYTYWCCKKCGQTSSTASDEYEQMDCILNNKQTAKPTMDCRDGGKCQFIRKQNQVKITQDRIDRFKAQKAERERRRNQ